MTNYYEEYEDAILEYEELRTPKYQITDISSYNDSDRSLPDDIQPPSCAAYMPGIDKSAQPSEKSDEIPFDRDEWYIIDSHSGKKRPPRQDEFLRLLLENSRYSSYVSWLDQSKGLFRLLLPNEVAALWKKVKGRQTSGDMDYDIFSRGVRYHYKTGVMIKTHKKYTFCFK
jgi:hypothetical protein